MAAMATAKINWGEDLWDQYDNIASVTNKGLELLDKYGQFTKELSAIETDYASKLRRLVKNYMIKKKDEEENMYTVIKAFNLSLSEINDIANQHEIIAEELLLRIVKEISILVKEMKEERKRHLAEGTKLQNGLHGAITSLEKSKRSYEKAFRDAEKAQDNYTKADADLNLSRAEVEKSRLISVSKKQLCDDAMSDYATHLQRTNELQRAHYRELMPKVFHQFQDMEERRAACMRNFIQSGAAIRRKVLPIVEKCIEGMVTASEQIDPQEDSRLVVERYKSGILPPDDYPFEDLSAMARNSDDGSMMNGSGSDASENGSTPNGGAGGHRSSSHGLHHSASSVTRSETIRGTFSASKFRKRNGIFGIFGSNKDDFSDLPPNQRRKKIQAKIDLISNNIQQETAVREALIKMKSAYESNVKMGDPNSVNGQLAENSKKQEQLQADLKKYQTMLQEVVRGGGGGGNSFTPVSSAKKSHSSSISSSSNLSVASNGAGAHRSSLSDESLSRSESETSVNHTSSNGVNGGGGGGGGLTNGGHHHLSNGHLGGGTNGSSTVAPAPTVPTLTSPLSSVLSNGGSGGGMSSLFKLSNGMGSGTPPTATITPTLLSPGGLSNKSSSTLTPTSAISSSLVLKDENDSSNSHESGIEFADDGDSVGGGGEDDDFEEPMLAALGSAKALYPFEGQDEGSIKMAEGEDFEVVELDQGDGWTRVRRLDSEKNYEEGFVPTSYIQTVLYNGSS